MITVRTLEWSCLGQVLDLLLEMFVGEMEDHRLLADLLLAHQTPLHGGRGGPAGRSSVSTPPPVTATPTRRHWRAGVHVLVLPLRPPPHDGVEIFENISMSDAVVESQIVTYLGFIRARFYWTFEGRRLKIK